MSGGAVLNNEIIPQDLWKVFARENVFGTTDQSSQEAIQLFQAHRTLISEALEYRAQAIAFFVSQWLWFHGATLRCSALRYKAQ